MADIIRMAEADFTLQKSAKMVTTLDNRVGFSADMESVGMTFVIRSAMGEPVEGSGLWLLEIKDATDSIVHSKQFESNFEVSNQITINVSLRTGLGEGQLALADQEDLSAKRYSIAWGVSPTNYGAGSSIRIRHNGGIGPNLGLFDFNGTSNIIYQATQVQNRGALINFKADFASVAV